MDYKSTVIRGVSWLSIFRVASRAIAFVRVIILARILIPAQFGVFGVAQLILTCIDILMETGVNVFLIQEKDKIDKYVNSAWVVSLLRGFIISATLYLGAPFIASFFNSPEAESVIHLAALVPFIKGFINPSIVRFQKDLQFQKEFWLRTVIFVIDSAVAVVFSFWLKSASGIVYGLIAGAITEVFLSWIFIKPTPIFSLDSGYFSKLFHRGKWVTASGILTYIFQNGDNIVTGKLLGITQLGFYQMAYSFSILPISEITDVFSKVAFPLYVKLSGDHEKLKSAFTKIVLVTVLLAIPVSLVLYLFSRELVVLLLGDKWLPVANVLSVLALFGLIRSIAISPFPLFLAVKKQHYVTITSLVSTAVLALSIFPLATRFGLVGVAYSVILASIASLPFSWYFTFKILGSK